MIVYKKGNLLEAPEVFIAHGCNAQGAMNSGVAKEIRRAYPRAYIDYARFCERASSDDAILGRCVTSYVLAKVIGNLITQRFYGKDGKRYADTTAISNAMNRFISDCRAAKTMYINESDPIEIAIPKIGCGLGGLSWEREVRDLLQSIALENDVTFVVYEL